MNDPYDGPVTAAQQSHQLERACAQLIGLINGITADGQLHDMEIQFLRTWLSEQRRVAGHWLGSSIAAQIDLVLADGQITQEERAGLLGLLQAAAGVQFAETGATTASTTAFPADGGPVEFAGRSFCLTGKFFHGSRGACTAATQAAGGQCVDSVTRKTHYLVIGSAGATASWKQASYGAKIDAAMKLKERGHPIQILAEETWQQALASRS